MKGQSEILIFVLLFIISIALFTAATIWSKNIFQQNVDVAKVENSEKFAKELNEAILNVIKFGGSQEIRYNIEGTIELLNDNTIEIKVPISLPLSEQWVNISSDTSFIRERKEGDYFKIQINYTNNQYKVEFFTEGPKLATPSYIVIENNETYFSTVTVIKIKITFI
ncbi:MAG: hypothetical protein QXD43_02185 [Candidatus Aenigmatarchaeota archaeon]